MAENLAYEQMDTRTSGRSRMTTASRNYNSRHSAAICLKV